MGSKYTTCPGCGRRRVKTWPSEPDTCPRCEVRAELARRDREDRASDWMDRVVAGGDPGPFPARWLPEQGATREWIAGHVGRALGRRAEREPVPEPEPAPAMSLRDRLEAWLWH
jgi:hypothetical protein